jgi:hypothetical protein
MEGLSNDMRSRSGRVLRWIRRIGFWGFLFFLVKGLLWLLLPWLLARGIFS